MNDSIPYHFDTIEQWVGKDLGVTDWLRIDQERIDLFARATNDMNPLHVDPEWAKTGPFGSTIAHGFLTLSLLSYFSYEAKLQPEGVAYSVNYGFDRIRFMAPVMVGDRVRNRCKLVGVSRSGDDRCVFKSQNTIEIENKSKPALVASWLGMCVRKT